MTTQHWSPPAPVAPTAPNRLLTLVITACVLSVMSPVLAMVSFAVVFFGVSRLPYEEACETYACGEGVGWIIMILTFCWMCLMWLAGLVVAAVAIWRTVSVGRAVTAALLTALGVTVIAVAVDYGWVVWSV